jgi:2'-hydroxyisoflavone reductase
MTTVLILGGTEFVGRAFVEEALARGYDVTTLNRGSKPPIPGTTSLVGDRTRADGLAALSGGTWDIVVDTWSWQPRAVTDAAAALAGSAASFVYVSTRSVYAAARAGADESAILVAGDPADETFDDYATAKAGGELGAVAGFGDRALLLRPGAIIGPYENTGRVPWWLNRIARGGEVVAPGPADASLQYVDARDLAAFGLDAALAGLGGAFDTVCATGTTSMGEFLDACIEVTGSDARLRWFEPERILEAGVAPWRGLPLWFPPGDDYESLHQADSSKALAAGLVIRPLVDTVRDTWAWVGTLGGVMPERPYGFPLGLSEELERALLDG